MPLVTLIFLLSLLCLPVSLISLTLIINHYYSKPEIFKRTSIHEAIFISGCNSGIGLELAKYLHKTCNFKIMCGFLKPEQSDGCKELSELSTRSKSQRLFLQKLDLTCSDDVDKVIENIGKLKKEGDISHISTLVNNAGILTYGEFDWLTWNHIQDQIDVNLIGTLRLTRALVPYLIESKGRIINVSSVNDSTVFPGLSVYSATKSAITTFSRGLSYELRKFGVHVVTIRLGDFARLTNIMARHTSNPDDMWNGMNSKKQAMYKDFFNDFNKHLLENYGMTSPKEFEESTLFRDFSQAILSKSPPATITCTPISFRVFYFVIELVPIWLQYHILDLLIRIGFQWKPPNMQV